MQLHQTDSGLTIKFEPEPLCPRVEWIYKRTYAIYSYSDKAVVSASACYEMVAHIIGVDISAVDGVLAIYREKRNDRTNLYRSNHDVFFGHQADIVLSRFANIRVVRIHLCEDCKPLDDLPHQWVAESTLQDGIHLCGSCANHIETESPSIRFAFVQFDARPAEVDGRYNESIHKYPIYDFDAPQINDRYAHLIEERNPND